MSSAEKSMQKAGDSATPAVPLVQFQKLEPGKLPIFYRDEYNLRAMGLEKLHPFDAAKYGKVVAALEAAGALQASQLIAPPMLPEALLHAVHDDSYLASLRWSGAICRVIELPLCFLPASLLRRWVLAPMQYAAMGSVMAAAAAVTAGHGWAVNLGGGFHHASRQHGHGFCVYADISMIVAALRSAGLARRFAIVDLDAHQGDGHERDFEQDRDVVILDQYTPGIFPGDRRAARRIDVPLHYSPGDSGDAAQSQLQAALPRLLRERGSGRIDAVIYNAGTDTLVGDPLSGLSCTEASIIARDEFVFRCCGFLDAPGGGGPRRRPDAVPVVMLLSGGYQKSNAGVIARSLLNLRSKFGLW